MTKKIQICFLIALIVHILLFFSLTTILRIPPLQNKTENSLPAYIYKEEKNNPIEHTFTQPQEKSEPVSENGLSKPMKLKTPQTLTRTEELSIGKGEQNINLKLKADNKMDHKLLNILTKAVASHLKYPKIAVDFRLKGTTVIGFILSPNGELSEIKVLHSGGNIVLDQEALRAISTVSPLIGINHYLQKPEFIQFAILFG